MMKVARIAYKGSIHIVTEKDGKLAMPDGQMLEEDQVVWLPPVNPGSTVFALGLNYADHAKELDFSPPKDPLIFLKGPNTFIGHRGETKRPITAKYMHYECELAVVIGRRARHVSRKNAHDYIAGYTIANDYAIRDYLENYYRPNLRVKNRDTCTPLGPWLVDASDIEDPCNLTLRTYINGNQTQEGHTRNMIFTPDYLIEYLSSFMTLNPGDIILTGTPEGLENTAIGDEVMTEIEGIGRLKSTIIADQPLTEEQPLSSSMRRS